MPPDSSELALNTRLMMVASQSQWLQYSPAGSFIVNCCSEPYLSKNLKAHRMPQLDEERPLPCACGTLQPAMSPQSLSSGEGKSSKEGGFLDLGSVRSCVENLLFHAFDVHSLRLC